VVTPPLASRLGMGGMLLSWGIAATAISAAFIAFARERPAAAGRMAGKEEPTLVFTGLKSMFSRRDFVMLLAIFFIGLGMFNAVTTWIEQILSPHGFSAEQAGVAGGLMLVGGIAGALVMPLVSDTAGKRVPFLSISLAGILPSLLGVIFTRSYPLLLVCAIGFGFFLLSSGPIGFQYGAEITRPAPEGTSNSFLILMGQISGIAFIFLMDAMKSSDGSMLPSLLTLLGLTLACFVLSLFLREPRLEAVKAARSPARPSTHTPAVKAAKYPVNSRNRPPALARVKKQKR
jgi:MFS family permease